MGFRFRKSISLGGGFKVNLSKSGVGYSWGTKGVRFTKTAKGRKRTTLSVPGTGISFVTESGGNRKSAKNSTQRATNNFTQPTNTSEKANNERGNHMAWVKFAICFFLGFFGVHKFMEKKVGIGLLYLFTMGLFGFGWIYDCVKYLISAIKSINFNADKSNSPVESSAAVTTYTSENHPVELSAPNPKKTVKKVLLWVVTVFFALAGLGYLTSGGVIAGLFAFAFVALVIPIDSWQNTVRKYITGKVKTIIAVVLAVLCFATIPPVEPTDVENTVPTTVATKSTDILTTETSEVTPEATTEVTTELTTEPTTEPTTTPTAKPTTESTTEPTTVPTADPTTDPTTNPTTAPTTEPTAEPTTNPTTAPTTAPTTEPTAEPTEDNGRDYVVNTSTGKFHYPSCSSAEDIKAANRWDYHGTRDELIDMGFVPCKRCDP